jgi:hypothetical protein
LEAKEVRRTVVLIVATARILTGRCRERPVRGLGEINAEDLQREDEARAYGDCRCHARCPRGAWARSTWKYCEV